MNSMLKNWYAVYTKPFCEKKVARLLERKKIESYCPVVSPYRQWIDRGKGVEIPLFSSYVFVRIYEADRLRVSQIDGILNFVYWLKQPAIIQNGEIDAIRCFLSEHRHPTLEKTVVNVNDCVRTTSSSVVERGNNLMEIKHKVIKVLLPSLGYKLVAEIEKPNVEIPSLFLSGELAIAQ